ncbi:glycosyltransferase family 2 protein [Paenibacillus caseinilyticus]|uniref:Glycosyltransferase 2-like domain-containing protein n=1 Tax=Paenibacillus mucilaginosus K02 TaxID=997761 RepID=I0BBC1_9BACL|nr:glycosyltransferase [Paenibacillus mucilaginosus]AFH59668.1 hypothetical protein B2K_02825 [Paenibacillus mucilaginosus K02]
MRFIYILWKYSILLRLKLNQAQIWGRHWYDEWIKKNEYYSVEEINNEIAAFEYKPLISVLLPVYNVKEEYLVECIESVLRQYYENWELCIADDCSEYTYIKGLLNEYSNKDKRIKVVFRSQNGHISANSNTALELVNGEFTALLDNDDKLQPFALYEVVKALNDQPGADLLYSNEDKLINNKRKVPFLKPGWDKNLLLEFNYLCHLVVYRTDILKRIGGFRVGFEGAQDWDLALRFTDETNHVYHIPKILYHWRITDTSTSLNEKIKPYVKTAQKRTIKEARLRESRG